MLLSQYLSPPSGINGLLTKCAVKMAGYIGQAVSFFVEVHKLQKRTRPISRHFYQVLSLVNKGFMIWHLGKFFLRDIVGLSPERARQIPLAHSHRGYDNRG